MSMFIPRRGSCPIRAIITVADNATLYARAYAYIDSFLINIIPRAHVRGSRDTIATRYACRVHKELIMYCEVLAVGKRAPSSFSRAYIHMCRFS